MRNSDPYFIIIEEQLYWDSDKGERQKVTHLRRLDGGGIDYLELWVSEGKVLVGHSVGDEMFTLTVTRDGKIDGKVPGGYQYNFVVE